jgi:hypothetical protein
VPPDALLTGIAVLTLLSHLSEDRALLLVADDAQWLNRGSLDALAFAARRLDAEPLVLLLSARGNLPPPGFERDFPELLLEPLSTQDAARLLDAQPHPPHGRAREQVLAQAAGNPMALIELSRIIGADPSAGRRWAAELLPPTERLAVIITGLYGTLPPATQEALLLAAVADSPDMPLLPRPRHSGPPPAARPGRPGRRPARHTAAMSVSRLQRHAYRNWPAEVFGSLSHTTATTSVGSITTQPVSRSRRTRPSGRTSTPVSFSLSVVTNPT